MLQNPNNRHTFAICRPNTGSSFFDMEVQPCASLLLPCYPEQHLWSIDCTLSRCNSSHCSVCAPQRDELETKYQRVSPEEVEEGWKHVHEVSAVACMHGDNCSVGDACQVGSSTLKMCAPHAQSAFR
jgi:nitrate reductase assembly molybdenum cofactor insertion protein NarJ